MIIDAHSHMINNKYFKQLIDKGGEWARERIEHWLLRRGCTKPQLVDIVPRLDQLERTGIDLQVVTPQHRFDSNYMPADTPAQLAFASVLNDSMAALMEDSKGRLIAVGTVPLADFERGGRQEMERAIKSLGLKGISVISNIKGKPLDSPEFEPFWASAVELDIPVYVHPTDAAGKTDRSYEAEYDLSHNFGWPFETTLTLSRMVFSGMMERYPTLKIVSHHLGGMIPFFWGRILETYEPENQRLIYSGQVGVLPKPLFEYFSKFYYDTAVGGSALAIKCAYDIFGADPLVFATDAPWGPGSGEGRLREYPEVIRSLGFPEEDNNKILAGNARRILKLA